MSFETAERVANAVLYEGYVLYPYRASAAKNRLRWQIGLIVPRDFATTVGSDPSTMQTECLAEVGADASVTIKIRCLHVQQRSIERAHDGAGNAYQPVEHLSIDGRQWMAWDEAVEAEFEQTIDLRQESWRTRFMWVMTAAEHVESIHDSQGVARGRVVRRRRPVNAAVDVATEPLGRFVKIRVKLENLTLCSASTLAEREEAVRQSLAGTHTMLAIAGGAFVSLLEPPPEAIALARACVNERTWPVLAGRPGSRAVMLSSPMIMYDYPAIAPESPGDFCDATEIDEMLMLRVRTLTDEEKREGRATDVRAAAIIDRADGASPAALSHLHGAVRQVEEAPPLGGDWESFVNPPDAACPEMASIEIGAARIARGARVQLRPSHRADSMDLCLDGRLATVSGVYRTLEDQPYIAVLLDDDPFAAGGARYRRSLFFHPDELVPLDAPDGDA